MATKAQYRNELRECFIDALDDYIIARIALAHGDYVMLSSARRTLHDALERVLAS